MNADVINGIKAVIAWVRNLFGNKPKVVILILVFVAILVVLSVRCAHAAEIDLRAGASFGPGGTGAVLGLNLDFPVGNNVYLYGGTLLWSKTPVMDNTWSWEAGVKSCRWRICARLGASYVQNVNAIIGAHTNYNLELSCILDLWRVHSVDYAHFSDAGTSPVNKGLNAGLVAIRLQ